LQSALVRGGQKGVEVLHRAVVGVHVEVVGDVVAVVAQRRREKRQEPDAGDAEILDVIEPLEQAGEVPDAVVVAVEEGLDVRLVDDRVLVPERIGHAAGTFHGVDSSTRASSLMTRATGTCRRRSATASAARPSTSWAVTVSPVST